MGKLTGKVAVVTGASKGIGAATAKALAADGASVVVNYASSREGAEQVVEAIEAAGGKATAIGGSVARATDMERLMAEAKRTYGTLDILINNAGVYAFVPLEAITEEEFNRQFGINVLGLLLATREAAKHMREGSSVVNVSSLVSRITPPMSAIYSATKASVDAITAVLAKELGPRGIRVNAVNPGLVETEGTASAGMMGSDFEKQAVAQTPLGRIGQPGDIARVAAFLASDDAGWITGETLIASGGFR